MTDRLQKAMEKQLMAIREDYYRFLRFASVSADPEYKGEVLDCCHWLAKYLECMGLHVEVWETSGYPVIYADNHLPYRDKPTLLLYGHYDVQPVDPLEEWISPPFEPTERDGQVYARGAQDNKGQIFYTISALKLMLETEGELPLNVKLCIEGEEEVKSTGLAGILDHYAERLRADSLLMVDMEIPAPNKPGVTLGVRGMAAVTLELIGSNTDLHSGGHGGLVYNPNRAMVELLAKLVDEEGRVTVPGFYDDVKELSVEERRALDLSFDAEQYRQDFGAEATGGERNRLPEERVTIRPTLEINGIGGGYAGPGFKTVIPAKATAKISCRLVPDQDPEKILTALGAFIEEHCPPGIEARITPMGGGKAMRCHPDSLIAQRVSEAYQEIYNAPCSKILSGGSIPIAEKLVAASESDAALMGLGLPTDKIHAPNEHFGWDRFQRGILLIASILRKMSSQ